PQRLLDRVRPDRRQDRLLPLRRRLLHEPRHHGDRPRLAARPRPRRRARLLDQRGRRERRELSDDGLRQEHAAGAREREDGAPAPRGGEELRVLDRRPGRRERVEDGALSARQRRSRTASASERVRFGARAAREGVLLLPWITCTSPPWSRRSACSPCRSSWPGTAGTKGIWGTGGTRTGTRGTRGR